MGNINSVLLGMTKDDSTPKLTKTSTSAITIDDSTQATTTASASTVEQLLPDELLGKITVLADYGSAAGEPTCPAARFAWVSRRWNRVYENSRTRFQTNELKRIPSWSIQDQRPGGNEDVQTIVDSWVGDPANPVPNWWTSGYVFETMGREWVDNPKKDAKGGPFSFTPWNDPPHLRVSFARPVRLRAIALEARNRPRMLRIRSDQGTELLVEIPPPSQKDRSGRPGLAKVELSSPQYMELVAQKLPQGSPASPKALAKNSTLPVVLSEPLYCQGALDIYILKSQEVGWVGINRMVLLE